MDLVRFDALPPSAEPLRGRLRLRASGTLAQGVVVLCHPHPAFGGNMDVWLLPTLSHALAEDGWTVLRFDFRSVEHGVQSADHREELEDLAGAVAYLRTHGFLGPDDRLVMAGWSFGALVSLLYGLDDPQVTDWVGLAPPTQPLGELAMAALPVPRIAQWSARRIAIVGEHDQFFPPSSLGSVSPHQTYVLEHCDHFFFDRDVELAQLLVAALRAPHRDAA